MLKDEGAKHILTTDTKTQITCGSKKEAKKDFYTNYGDLRNDSLLCLWNWESRQREKSKMVLKEVGF